MSSFRSWGTLLTRWIKWGFSLLGKSELSLGLVLGLYVTREGGTKVDIYYELVLFFSQKQLGHSGIRHQRGNTEHEIAGVSGPPGWFLAQC